MRRSLFAITGALGMATIIDFRSRDHVCEDHLEIREAYALFLERFNTPGRDTNPELTKKVRTEALKMLDQDNLSAYTVYCQEAYSQMLEIRPSSALRWSTPKHERDPDYYIIFYKNSYNQEITFGRSGQTRINISTPIAYTQHFIPIQELFGKELAYEIEYDGILKLDRTQKCTISGPARDEFLQLLHQQINGMFPDLDLVGDKCRPNRESFHKLPYSNSIPVKQLLIIPRVDQSALLSEKEFFDGILRIAAKE